MYCNHTSPRYSASLMKKGCFPGTCMSDPEEFYRKLYKKVRMLPQGHPDEDCFITMLGAIEDYFCDTLFGIAPIVEPEIDIYSVL